MGLNISKGNMYDFVTHTWNTIKGQCYHDCSYCYMKRWKNLKPARFDEKEMKTDLGKGKFIFVGSSNDLFSVRNGYDWISRTLYHCTKYPENKYLFQTKNPEEMSYWGNALPDNTVICTTLESNRHYSGHMNNSPHPSSRQLYFRNMIHFDKYITIEPILEFDLLDFVEMIKNCNPIQVNIGADTGNNNLPEPSWFQVESLIKELEQFTKVKLKKNIDRLKA